MAERARWYVVHTYSGYENKVKVNLEKLIDNRGLQDLIPEIEIPMEEVVEVKEGKQKIIQRKIYPGYVFIRMVMTDETWYVVRNTRGCTGFVGPGSKPVPLTEEEVKSMGIIEKQIDIDIKVGENIKVVSGPLENFEAIIKEINLEKRKIKAFVNMFGRETSVELEFNQIEKLD